MIEDIFLFSAMNYMRDLTSWNDFQGLDFWQTKKLYQSQDKQVSSVAGDVNAVESVQCNAMQCNVVQCNAMQLIYYPSNKLCNVMLQLQGDF